MIQTKRKREKARSGWGTDAWSSSQIIDLIGIPAIYLNKLVERQSFGIEPSAISGSGRGSRRIFPTLDVVGIALVWWLFKSGLRSQVIAEVLESLPRQETPDAVSSVGEIANHLLWEHFGGGYRLELVIQQSLTPSKQKESGPIVRLGRPERSDSDSVLIVPLSSLIGGLIQRIRELRPNWKEWESIEVKKNR